MERTIVSLIFSAIFSLPWTLAMAQGEADPFAAEPAPATGSATPATQAKPVPAADAPEADAKPAAPAKPAEFPNLVPNAGLKEPGDDKLPKLWRFSRWHGGEDVDHALCVRVPEVRVVRGTEVDLERIFSLFFCLTLLSLSLSLSLSLF